MTSEEIDFVAYFELQQENKKLKEALEKIFYLRKPGQIPKKIDGRLIEEIEIIARMALGK